MSEQDRIDKLEQQVRELTERLSKLENPEPKQAYVVPSFMMSAPEPPPIIVPEPAEPPPASTIITAREDDAFLLKPAPKPTSAEPATPVHRVHPAASTPINPAYPNQPTYPSQPEPDEIEYKFGINALLRGGAAVVLCALLFLVPVLISRGLITPTVQFGGEIAICLAFIAVGIWKRDEREDFGQLMVALGTAGMFASFVGGHVHKKLFDSNMLVGLFMTLSLLTLVYSNWRSSKSFLVMGMTGGLAAAMLPLNEQRYDVNLPLHFLILVPAIWITIRNRWADAAAAIWVVSTLALLPSLTSNLDQSYRIGAVYLNCALCLVGYAATLRNNKQYLVAAVIPVILLVSGGIAVGVDSGQKGTWHAIVLALIGLALAFVFRKDSVAKNALLLGSLLVFSLLTPLGLTQPQAAIWYGVESLILLAFAVRTRHLVFFCVGILTWVLSMAAYLVNPVAQEQQFARLGQAADLGFLVLSAASMILLLIYALKNLEKDFQEISLASVSAILAWIFLRILHVIIVPTGALTKWDTSLLALSIGAVVLALICMQKPRPGLIFTALGYSLATGIIAVPRQSFETVWVTILGLWGAGISLGLWLRAYSTKDEGLRFVVPFCAGTAISIYLIAFSRLVGARTDLGVPTLELVSVTGVAVIWTLIASKSRTPVTRTLAYLATALASGFNIPSGKTLGTALTVVTLVLIWVLYATRNRQSARPDIAYYTVIWGWILVHFLSVSEPVRNALGLSDVSTVTVGWTLYAVALIAVGFWKEDRFLRYGSLFIFCVTVFKVFMIDLAALDSLIRVGVLMLLGMGMLAGGYRYLIWKRQSERAPQARLEEA